MTDKRSPTETDETADFAQLLPMDTVVPPDPVLAAAAHIPDYDAAVARFAADPDGFWDEIARGLEWAAPWTQVVEHTPPTARWFVGARCNITLNALDRHIRAGNGDKLAWLWVGEDGAERVFSYADALAYVCQIANALTALGVQRGDRVCIYMPLTPEGMAAMLACARIGAIHTVVYAGLGAGSIRDRIRDAEARVVIAADEGYRRNRAVPLLPIVRDALAQTPEIEHVLLWRRNPDTTLPTSSDGVGPQWHDFNETVARQPPTREAEIMDASDPLFLLVYLRHDGQAESARVHARRLRGRRVVLHAHRL